MSSDDSGLKYGWAILVTLPTGYKSHDYNVIAADDGVTPVIFESEAEARAAATGPKYGPLLARIAYPWRIAAVTEPFPGYWPLEPEVATDPLMSTEPDAAPGTASAHTHQTGAGASLDLMSVYDNLVPMIHAQCGDLASTANPVMFTFIDTCATRATTSMRDVPADVARALWTQGLQALRDIGDAALEPSRRIDAMSRLGLERGFCPDLAVLVFQFWSVHEMRDGRLQKWHSYEPRAGMPHRLQVELRAHGCEPVVAEWKVAQQEGRVCVIPPPPHHFAGPIDLAPPILPTAADVAAVARLGAENRRRRIEEAEAKLASTQLPTFVVRSPPLRDFQIGIGGGSVTTVNFSDLRYVTCRELESGVVKDHWPEGRVTLQVVDGLVVPTYYETGSESSEVFWFSGTTMVVNRPNGEPAFKVVVIQPLKVVSSGP